MPRISLEAIVCFLASRSKTVTEKKKKKKKTTRIIMIMGCAYHHFAMHKTLAISSARSYTKSCDSLPPRLC